MENTAKQKAETEIAEAEAAYKNLRIQVEQTEQARWKALREEQDAASEAIKKKYTRKYDSGHKTARAVRDIMFRRITDLKIKHAAVLCEYPIDSVMIEWCQDFNKWSQTGRTGKLEVFLDGSEWPANDYPKPQISTVIIRVRGKNGRPTKQARYLSHAARDTSIRKYCWLPEGKKPA